MPDAPSVSVDIDFGPVTRLIENLRSGIDNLWKGLNDVRDRISAELRATLETILPKIGEAIGGALAEFAALVTGLLDNLATLPDVQNMLTAGVVDPLLASVARAFEERAPDVLAMHEKLEVGGAAGQRLKEQIDNLPPGGKGFLNWSTAVLSLFSIAGAYQAGTVELYKQAAYEETRPVLLSPVELVEAERRGELDAEAANEFLARQGLSAEQQEILRRLSKALPTPLEIVTLERRGELTSEQAEGWLARLGYDAQAAAILRQATLAVPSPQDIVSLAGREAFEDDQAADLGLDAEYENVDWTWADKIGLREPWRRFYWRAHWENVSPNHIFQMRQRTTDNPDPKVGGSVTTPSGLTFSTIISDAMVDAGMKWIDFTPQWRNALLQLSYNPLTRVDVRRMHDLGELDRAGVVRAYLDLGYTPANAERLAKFSQTLVDRSRKAARLTAGAPMQKVILEAYVRATLSRGEAKEALQGLSYTADEIEEVLTRADYERERAKADAVRDGVKRLYVAGLASEEEASALLREEAFSQGEADYLLELWRPDRRYKGLSDAERHEKDLGKADLLSAYREHTLGREGALEGLVALGYSEVEAAALVGLEDAKDARAKLKEVQATVRAQYLAGRVTRGEAWASLQTAGTPEDRLQILMDKWDVERDARTPDLPISTIEQLAREELITADEVQGELVRRGYTAREADWLTKLWGRKMAVSLQELDLKKQKLEQDWQLQQQKLDASVAKDLRARQTQLDVAAAKLEGSLKLELVKSDRAYKLADKQTAAKEQQIAAQAQLQMALQQKKEDLALKLEESRTASARAKLEADMVALDKKLAAQQEIADRAAAAKLDLEAQKAALQAERDKQQSLYQQATETRAEQRQIAKEQRTQLAQIEAEGRAEARTIAKENRTLAATVTLKAVQASKEAALAAAQAQALSSYEASLKDLVGKLIADATAQLRVLSGAAGMSGGKAY